MASQAVCEPGIITKKRPAAAVRPETVGSDSVNEAPPAPGVLRRAGRMLVTFPRVGWMTLDLVALGLGMKLAFWLFHAMTKTSTHAELWPAIGVVSIAYIVAGLVFGLYDRETNLGRSRILTRLLLTSGLAFVLAYAGSYVFLYSTLSRRVGVAAFLFTGIVGIGPRFLACWASHKLKRRLITVGNANLFKAVRQHREQGFLHDFELVGYVNAIPDDNLKDRPREEIGQLDQLLALCQMHRIEDVVVSTRIARHPDVMKWLLPCIRLGCRVTNEEIFYEKATGQIILEHITPNWFLFADIKARCEEQSTIKRLFDVCVAAVGLVVSMPIWCLIAVLIKLDDGGPVFYSQDRVGQNGRVFRLYKFRTMIQNAENGKSVWAKPGDPRTTFIGKYLRRTRLDELPQLYNILIGEMSVVGPRPERPGIVTDLARALPFYEIRHIVKPGLTGWAQISFRYGSSIEDAKRKLQFDLCYLKEMCIELDVVILFRTLGTFLKGAC